MPTLKLITICALSAIAALALWVNQQHDSTPTPALKYSGQPLVVEKPEKALSPENETRHPKASNDIALTNEQEVFDRQDSNPRFSSFAERYEEITQRRAGKLFDPQALWQASQQTFVWEFSDKTPSNLPLTEAEAKDGRHFFKLSQLKLESLADGDSVELPLSPAGNPVVAKVTEVLVNDNGENLTWKAEADSNNEKVVITLTKGKTVVVGGVLTPSAHYSIYASGDNGWIVNSGQLFKSETDPVHVDASNDIVRVGSGAEN